MTASTRPDADVVRLHVRRRPAIDTEGPYVDDDGWSGPTVDGSLALALPLGPPGPAVLSGPGRSPRRLHLLAEPVSDLPTGPRDPAQARLWEDPPAEPAAQTEPEPAEPEVSFAPVRTARPELPPPGPQAASLVRAVLEVLAGDRAVRQLSRCTSSAVYDDLEAMVRPDAPRPWAGSLRRLLLCEPVPGVAEVTAIVAQGARTVAMALRLEGMDGRWQLTALQLG